MSFEEVALVVSFILTIILWNLSFDKLPPGPIGLPFLGHLLQIVKDPHLKLSKWAKKYGKIYTIRLCLKTAVVINDPKVFHEILNKRAASGKDFHDVILLFTRGPYGILSSEGKAWEELRKFCIRNLRNFGLGKRSLEPIMLSEAQGLVDWIKETQRKGQDESVILQQVLKLSSVNTLWTIVSGERIHLDNQSRMNVLLSEAEKAMQRTVQSGLIFFSWLKYIAPNASGYNALDRATAEIHEFIRGKIEEHKKDFVERSPRDLIDCYIEHVKETKDPQSNFYGDLGETNIISSIMELFIAGADTIALTLNWSTIYLATHPEVQRKFRQEVDEMIGRERESSLSDRARMPYTEALILEIFRYSSIVPQGAMHKTLEDITYGNFVIPKGTIIMTNIYGIHYDENIWGDPEKFRPERWISGNKNLKEALVAFQPGKRKCIGEPLVWDIIFLFLTKLIQNFCILPHPNVSMEEYLKRDVGVFVVAGAHKLIFNCR